MSILQLSKVTKHFGGLVAVDRADLAVTSGTIHGLIGPNGAGKTTLFSLITGYYRPSGGQVFFNGHDITNQAIHVRARAGLVRTFQGSILFPEQSVVENVINGALARSGNAGSDYENDAHEILNFCKFSERRNVAAKELSHGEQRVLGIAIALAAKPKVLLLDEPFTGMTALEKDRVGQTLMEIRSAGTTIVLVEHDMRSVMRLCNVVTVLNFGKVVAQGTPDDIRRHPDVMTAYLGSAA